MQKPLINYPKRGEIFIADLDPSLGRELRKKRPVVIVSRNFINKDTSSVIIIPASSRVPHTIGLEMVSVGKAEGLDKESVLLPVFIRSIDQQRLIKKIGILFKTKMEEVEESIKLVLDIDP